jgi:gamma-glutamylcyclotransferase (GGCT)/AIG2-like uncharacterized protein YtfP
MSLNLFAYGTLVFPEIFRQVTGAAAEPESAYLDDYVCRRLRGRPYPGALPRPGAVTRGVLYPGLDAATWKLLDAYEASCYERRLVEVRTARGTVSAHAYVLPSRKRYLLSHHPWRPVGFDPAHWSQALATGSAPR